MATFDQNTVEWKGPSQRVWHGVQGLVWLLGVGVLVALVVAPQLGLHALWNVLIPVAPLLLAVAPGVWRNICPLGSTSLLARHLGRSKRLRISAVWNERLALVGFVGLLALVPLRHVVFDVSGLATAIVLVALALVAIGAGLASEWKSGWCSGLCPVHPVEKLYGSEPLLTVPNAHCTSCERCVALCADSTRGVHVMSGTGGMRRLIGLVMAGGFAGFVWGWFRVPDYANGDGWNHLGLAYAWPLGSTLVSLSIFLLLRRWLAKRHQERLVRAFAAAALACYYWYRVPALIGFGLFPGDGMLIDLSGVVPAYTILVARFVTTSLAVWLLCLRFSHLRSWSQRPPFAAGVSVPVVSSAGGS